MMFRSHVASRGSRSPSDRNVRFDGVEQLEQRLAMSTVLWDGGGDGVSVMDRFNWAGNQVPNAGDHAVIDVEGTPSLTLPDGDFHVKQLTLAEELTVSGGRLKASEAISIQGAGTLSLTAGVIEDPLLSGHARIDVLGRFKWTGGQIWGNGEITVFQGGTFVIEGDGPMDLRRDVYNHGNIIWNSGDIDGVHGPGTSWINEADGFFKIVADAKFRDHGSPDVLINRGVMVRDGAGEARILAWFENHGTLNVVSGLMKIADGGINTGKRHVGADGVLHYFSDYEHAAGSTLTGGGTTIWQAGVQTISGDWTSASFLHLTNTTVSGPGALSTDGPITWNHGRIDLAGGVHINPAGKVALMTTGTHVLATDIVNDGTLIWNRGQLLIENATITNNAGRFFYVQANGTANVVSGAGLVLNYGEVKKQLPTELAFGDLRLDNQGMVNVRNGRLILSTGFLDQVDGTALRGGSWNIFLAGNLVMPGAALDTIGAGASVVRWTTFSKFEAIEGLTRNQGSLEFIGGQTFTYDGDFVNEGTITLRRATKLHVTGDYTQTASGELNIHIANGFQLGSGRLVVEGVATLDGTASFTLFNGFTPSAGQKFLFVTANSGVSGEFSSLVLPGIGLTKSLLYGPGTVRLTFA